MRLKSLYEQTISKYKYLGQCDTLRRACDVNEGNWHIMMNYKKPISVNAFIKHVDMADILDDDETPTGWIKDNKLSDPDFGVYASIWGDKKCMFAQTAGFEFIFVEG